MLPAATSLSHWRRKGFIR